jgi:transposase
VCPATAGPTSLADGQRRPRYPSDTTDTEWVLIEPLLPSPACTRVAGGRPEAHPRREVVDAIRYLVHNGCVWRALPADFPPWRTVYGFFARWAADGTLDRVHDALRDQVRLDAGRRRQPSAAIIDSQSVRAADTVPKQSRGFDAAKKVNGRKRHVAVDTLGLLLVVLVTAASVQDRDGARPLLWRLRVA